MPAAYTASWADTSFQPHRKASRHRRPEPTKWSTPKIFEPCPPYLEGNPSVVAIADLGGARTYFVVPMLKENEFDRRNHDLPPGGPAIRRQANRTRR